MLGILFVITCFNVVVLGQEKDFATVTSLGSSVRFDLNASYETVTLSVLSPDGRVFSREFKAGVSPEFRLGDTREKYPDGSYSYELRLSPVLSGSVREELKAARAKDTSDELQRDLKRRGVLPTNPQVQSGGFTVLNGSIVVSSDTDDDRVAANRPARTPVQRPFQTSSRPASAQVASSGRINYKVQRHHPSFLMFDFVIADDLIVQGSACVGFDCVDGESFGTDTIRMKENNTRIQFDDTSVTAGFATNNWQIRANDQASGGSNFLGFVDQGSTGTGETGTIVFAVSAGAPANALRVTSSGIGINTSTPVLDMHANTSDTPGIRLEQNNSGGFTAQTWDIAGNEANFFVRDVTSGSRLPFRIRPGAPTSSLDISANGDVGIGTGSPAKKLHVSATNSQIFVTRPANTAGNFALINFGTNNVEKFLIGLNADGDPGVDKMSFFDLVFSGNTPVMTFTGGNVGIGTNAPTQKLSVNGTAGKTGGGTWDVFSDVRLKRIRGKYNSGLKAVMQLQPLRYEYKPDNALGLTPQGEHIGFSAQDVKKVMPEAVTTTSQGYLMVKSDPIIWSMLNAIKEQQKEIAELKRQIRQLRATRRRR
ncbi:MAG TPA: tail fiber domain-containing protein [Pyrinomonadaceae bacterium]|nr:tail fiber domain-containing protein [Pyrinomonadaceae bacterium]